MGFVLSKVFWFWTPSDYDVPDGATGLTPREKDIVKRTWKIVQADTKGNGIKLFLMFFKQYPVYQNLFEPFADISLDKLATNGRLLGHATSVMYALNSVVDNLDDPACLVELLHKIGSSHKPRGIHHYHFENLAHTVLCFLKEVVGTSAMDETATKAWNKTLTVANKVINESLENENA